MARAINLPKSFKYHSIIHLLSLFFAKVIVGGTRPMMFSENLAGTTKILYIDDDPVNCSLIKRVLEAYGYHVSLAPNGLRGLEQAYSEKPDLILLDINMPDMSGYEVALILRQSDRTKNTPIVFISSNTPSDDYLEVGGNGFIMKPIDVDLITGQVASYLHVQV